jgi:transposase InsO family protein
MSEWRNRSDLMVRINCREVDTVEAADEPGTEAAQLARMLISRLMEQCGAYHAGRERKSYAPWFKRLVVDCHERGQTYAAIAALTDIEVETLKGFRDSAPAVLVKESLDDKSQRITAAWRAASSWHRGTLDRFWSYLGRKCPDLSVARDEMRQILINLGLHTPRGPAIKNEGAQVKQCFAPHAIWEGDGKLVKIRINGELFPFCWYAFADQKTTLLVGSNVDATETSENFLAALKVAGTRADTYSVGILIDNRLPDSDLSEIRAFCREHNIILVRTFPGNAKSNGIIEGNFSVFERFVGDIAIVGASPAEIARSIAVVIAEIFTQQRNHSPRASLGGKSPDEVSRGAGRPEQVRTAIERLAKRLEGEERQIAAKWGLIAPAQRHFGAISPESELKIQRELGKYPAKDIIAAQASYIAQIAKHPENRYGPEYFLAILRHHRETIAKGVFNETYRAGLDLWRELAPPSRKTVPETAAAVLSEMIAAEGEPTPAHQMLRLDALAWHLARYGATASLPALWERIGQLAAETIRMSLRWWQAASSYLNDLIGELLHYEQDKAGTLEGAPSETCPWPALGTHNLRQMSALAGR